MPAFFEQIRLAFHGWEEEYLDHNRWWLYRSINGKEQAATVIMSPAGVSLQDRTEPLIHFSNQQLIIEPQTFSVLGQEQITYLINAYLRFTNLCKSFMEGSRS